MFGMCFDDSEGESKIVRASFFISGIKIDFCPFLKGISETVVEALSQLKFEKVEKIGFCRQI